MFTTQCIRCKGKKGFYTLEAALVLPVVILAVLSLGYFITIDSMWENCLHKAIDESTMNALSSPLGEAHFNGKGRITSRIEDEEPGLTDFAISSYFQGYSDGVSDNLTSYRLRGRTSAQLPLGFDRDFSFESRIKYRSFDGRRHNDGGLGPEVLQGYEEECPVWIFPAYGEKYHSKNCTYVKASVKSRILSSSVRRHYSACGMCKSLELKTGSIVYCFEGEDTAYHRGSCRSIKRHYVCINKYEAEDKGYSPCSKCGGG